MGQLVDPMASVRAYLAAEKSDATRRAYKADFDHYTAWCNSAGESPLPSPPAVVARYLAHLADAKFKVSTINRRAAAIRYAHKAANLEPPTNAEGVKATLRGIRRRLRRRRTKKAPATAATIAGMLERLPAGMIGIRDRALLLIGFAAALRRSELVALDLRDIEIKSEGALITIAQSKTDQEGEGQLVTVPRGKVLKPVAALEAWLQASGITSGPVFRAVDRHGNVSKAAMSDRSVARIVKRAAKACGLDETVFAGHSLRAGFVTTALDRRVDLFKIMDVTRHTEVKTLREYDRRARGFDDGAGEGFL